MMWLAWLVLPALALDGRDGTVLPGASPMLAGRGYVGLVGGALTPPYSSGTTTGAGLELGVGLSDRVGLFALVGTTRLQGFQQLERRVGGHVTLRGNVVQSDHVRLGLLLTASMVATEPIDATLGAGFAVQAGGGRTFVDLSVPSAIAARATERDGEYGLEAATTPLWMDVGLTVRVARYDRIRIGYPALVTWQIRREHFYVDLAATTAFYLYGASAAVGVRL